LLHNSIILYYIISHIVPFSCTVTSLTAYFYVEYRIYLTTTSWMLSQTERTSLRGISTRHCVFTKSIILFWFASQLPTEVY